MAIVNDAVNTGGEAKGGCGRWRSRTRMRDGGSTILDRRDIKYTITWEGVVCERSKVLLGWCSG